MILANEWIKTQKHKDYTNLKNYLDETMPVRNNRLFDYNYNDVTTWLYLNCTVDDFLRVRRWIVNKNLWRKIYGKDYVEQPSRSLTNGADENIQNLSSTTRDGTSKTSRRCEPTATT
jgi:hypothetical protein